MNITPRAKVCGSDKGRRCAHRSGCPDRRYGAQCYPENTGLRDHCPWPAGFDKATGKRICGSMAAPTRRSIIIPATIMLFGNLSILIGTISIRRSLRREYFGSGAGSGLGLVEADVCTGDRFRPGTAPVEISPGRRPCGKQGYILNWPQLGALMGKYRKSGWHYRVIEPGEGAVGDSPAPVERPQPDRSANRAMCCLLGVLQGRSAPLQKRWPNSRRSLKTGVAKRKNSLPPEGKPGSAHSCLLPD